MTKKVEYRVRPVTRYIITRYSEEGKNAECGTLGEYDRQDLAHNVAYALCKIEHDGSGEPIDSENYIYPKIPFSDKENIND